ncbi:MAG: hypothetical protein O7D86_13230 [Proteobacteria bacterium]|nr:hypothetical protein [Pseudomonadota bacterium]
MTENKIITSLRMVLMLFSLSVSLPVFSEDNSEENDNRSVKPLDGELVLPDDYNNADNKKCLTVCDRWGEDCLINPRTGSRK